MAKGHKLPAGGGGVGGRGEGGGNVIVIFYFKIILHVPCHLVSSDREY